ncbi:MAG: patatin-like phospholipase family protein [Lachnospiraceae bacterium]
MELQIDISKEYGIVLEGGGARGAYQIGAWKALQENKVRIKGISGASVGALNGALMCMDELEKAEYIWENITYSQVMDVDDVQMGKIMSSSFKSQNLQEILGTMKRILTEGGLDITPLRNLIMDTVDEEKIRSSRRDLFVVTYSLSDRKKIVADVKKLPQGQIGDMLLASAYFLAFKNEKLGGKRYVDGGSVDNVPIDPLLEAGYKDILVLRIYGLGRDSERFLEIPEDVRLYRIAPRQDLGGILDFSKKKAQKNMLLGYYDAMRLLYGLCGKHYYIDAPGTEAYYFDRMLSELELLKLYIRPILKEEDWEHLEGYRPFTEQIFPHLAVKLKLKENWNYKELYLAVLEEMAKKLRLKRLHIYTSEELIKEVQKGLGALDSRLLI